MCWGSGTVRWRTASSWRRSAGLAYPATSTALSTLSSFSSTPISSQASRALLFSFQVGFMLFPQRCPNIALLVSDFSSIYKVLMVSRWHCIERSSRNCGVFQPFVLYRVGVQSLQIQEKLLYFVLAVQVNAVLPSATVTFTVVNLAARCSAVYCGIHKKELQIFPPCSHRSLRDTSVQATSPWCSESSWSVVSENQVYLKSSVLDPRRCRSQKALLAIGMSLLTAALRVMQLQSVTA